MFNRNLWVSVTAMSASHKYAPEQDLRYAGNLQSTITVRNRRVLLEGEPYFAECKFVDACANTVWCTNFLQGTCSGFQLLMSLTYASPKWDTEWHTCMCLVSEGKEFLSACMQLDTWSALVMGFNETMSNTSFQPRFVFRRLPIYPIPIQCFTPGVASFSR